MKIPLFIIEIILWFVSLWHSLFDNYYQSILNQNSYIGISLLHCWNFLKTTDVFYDAGHNSDHCLKVWNWIIKYYNYCESGLTEERELLVLQAAALFHEQDDSKFGRNLKNVERDLCAAMSADGLTEMEINIVFEIIKNCSYKKRNTRIVTKDIEKMMQLLCSADLAEAVGSEAIDRSFAFHRKRIERDQHRTPTDREVWIHVVSFVEVYKKDGYMDRFEAIENIGIKKEVSEAISVNRKRIQSIRSEYKITVNEFGL